MVPDNLWFLITDHEIGRIQIRLHSLVGELPGTCRYPVRDISSIPDEVPDQRP